MNNDTICIYFVLEEAMMVQCALLYLGFVAEVYHHDDGYEIIICGQERIGLARLFTESLLTRPM